jgi:hypothetical protein
MRTTTTPEDLLIERYLHPAWRLAVVSTDDPTLAEEATVAGFVDGLAAAEREGSDAIGIEIVAATRRAVLTKGAGAPGHHHDGDSSVVAAFRGLTEKGRTAVWLSEVEGGTPEQIAPVLGLDPEAAARVCERASATMRANLAECLASQASNEDCRSVLSRMHLHAAAQLPADERREVSMHISGCKPCSVLLAMVVAPRPLLRGIVVDVPASLAPAVAARLAAREEGARRAVLHPLTRFTLGTAAAAVLAVSVGAAALLGGGDGDDAPELAAPAAVELDTSTPGGVRSTLTTPTGASVAVTTASSSRPDGVPTSTPMRAIDRARSLGSVSSGPPSGSTPPATTPTNPGPVTPPVMPPAPGEGDGPLPELPLPEAPGLPTDPVPCTGVELFDAILACETPAGESSLLIPTLPGL